jgi:hypothetical protein
VADDVNRVRVTEDEVAAAKLEIKLLERLGRPVDPRLRVVAAAKPAESPSLERIASAKVAAWREVLEAAAREASSGTPRDKPPLPSLRAHRNRASKPLDVAQVFFPGEIPEGLVLRSLAEYLPLSSGTLDAATWEIARRNWTAILVAQPDEADEESAEQSLGK